MIGMEKIAAAAVASALCAVVLRKNTPELSLLLVMAAGAVILVGAVEGASSVVDGLLELVDLGGVDRELLRPIIKVTGIAAITKITSELCKDAKESGLSAVVEMAGAAAAMVVVIPLAKMVLTAMTEMI